MGLLAVIGVVDLPFCCGSSSLSLEDMVALCDVSIQVLC